MSGSNSISLVFLDLLLLGGDPLFSGDRDGSLEVDYWIPNNLLILVQGAHIVADLLLSGDPAFLV